MHVTSNTETQRLPSPTRYSTLQLVLRKNTCHVTLHTSSFKINEAFHRTALCGNYTTTVYHIRAAKAKLSVSCPQGWRCQSGSTVTCSIHAMYSSWLENSLPEWLDAKQICQKPSVQAVCYLDSVQPGLVHQALHKCIFTIAACSVAKSWLCSAVMF